MNTYEDNYGGSSTGILMENRSLLKIPNNNYQMTNPSTIEAGNFQKRKNQILLIVRVKWFKIICHSEIDVFALFLNKPTFYSANTKLRLS